MNEVILSKLSNSIGKLLVFNISFIDKNYKSYEEICSDLTKHEESISLKFLNASQNSDD